MSQVLDLSGRNAHGPERALGLVCNLVSDGRTLSYSSTWQAST